MAEASPNRSRGIHAGAFALWLIFQLLALVIAAERFPLTARYTKTGEQNALAAIVIAQLLASSLLAPQLLRNLGAMLAAIATAIPFAALASFVSDIQATQAMVAEGYVIFWIVGLSIWIQIARSDAAKICISAFATLFAILGPLLWYLRAEFAAESWDLDSRTLSMTPINGVVSLLSPGAPTFRLFLLPAGLLVAGVTVSRFVRRRKF